MLREYVTSTLAVKRFRRIGPFHCRFDRRLRVAAQLSANSVTFGAPLANGECHAAVGAQRGMADGSPASCSTGGRCHRAKTAKLLDAGGQPGVVQRPAQQRRLRRVLKHANTAAHHGPRTANRAVKARDLRSGTIRPGEAERAD